MAAKAALYGCIEAGGTKWNLAIARDHDDVARTARVPTTSPAQTIGVALDFFTAAALDVGPIAALGIASFGPLDLDAASPDWGHILGTPKPGWSDADIVGPFKARFGCPIGLDTDVNGAVLAETTWGAAQGCASAAYVTVGTGIGGGALVHGLTIAGRSHTEMGHIMVRRHPDDRAFAGTCPFHGDCLEGLASGPAIIARWGASLSDLADAHDAQTIVAFYLAQLAVAQLALLASDRIIFGGGVLATPGLLPLIQSEASRLAAGYFGQWDLRDRIVAPGLGNRAGILGALMLARTAARG